MKEEFYASKAIGKTDLPDSPIIKTGEIETIGAANCTYKGYTYSPGSKICINNLVHKCGNNGKWFMINKDCRE